MTPLPGFAAYALVERFGPNTASVTVRPSDQLVTAVAMAAQAGVHLSIASGGRYSSALYWQPDDFDDTTLGELADTLTRCGVGSYAYHLSHADLFDRHIDLQVRVGSAFPLVGRRVVFVRAHVLPAHHGLRQGLVSCIFGAPDDLADLLAPLSERFVVEPCEQQNVGVASIMLQHAEVAGGLSTIDTVIDDLASILEEQRCDAHILIHHPRPARDDDAGGWGAHPDH